MKVTVEIDCTPDEARQFLGLPDVKPLQAAVMAQMEAGLADAAGRFSPDALLRSWVSMVPQGQEGLRDLFGRIFGPAAEGGRGKTGG